MNLTTMKYLLLGIICFVVLVGVSVGLDAANLTWYAPWQKNKQTEVLRNTEQYVTTMQANMRDAWQRYLNPNATEGQKKAAMQDWCAAANKVDDKYVIPTDAKPVARTERCWSGS